MLSRTYALPPLTALSSFEAAARNAGFKRAAAELNVTPAAVSHQVKNLEGDLGMELFRRYHRGVELTESGALLFVAIQRGLEQISEAVGQLRQRADSEAVTIQATTAVSNFWLATRLAEFWRSHGHVAVSQYVTDSPEAAPGSDLRIFYGDPSADGGECHLLFRDRIAVLAAPGFADHHRIRALSDLARVPLIHLNAEDRRWTGWQTWCAEQGYEGSLGAAFHVNNYAIALQAAQDGVGAVLGWEKLTGRLVSSGALVRVLDQSIQAPHDFHIRTRRNASERAMLLRNWLLRSATDVSASATASW